MARQVVSALLIVLLAWFKQGACREDVPYCLPCLMH